MHLETISINFSNHNMNLLDFLQKKLQFTKFIEILQLFKTAQQFTAIRNNVERIYTQKDCINIGR